MKVQTTLTGAKKKGPDAKKAKTGPIRDMVYWCKWRGVLRDTLDAFTGERVRILDGTQWGTWIIAPEGESNGRLEHLAWHSATCQFLKPDPRACRVITRMGLNGNVIVEAFNERDEPFVIDAFVGQSLQEAQQMMQLDGIHSLGYRDQMRGFSRFAKHGIINLAQNYTHETAHLRSAPLKGSAPIPAEESSSSDIESESDSSDSVFGEEKEKKKVKA